MSVVKSTSISVGQVGHDAVFMWKACQWYWQTLTKSNTLGFQNFLGCRGCYAYSQWYPALFSCPLSAPTVAGGIVSSLGSQRRAKPWKHIRETCGVKRRHSKAEKITWSNQQRQSIYIRKKFFEWSAFPSTWGCGICTVCRRIFWHKSWRAHLGRKLESCVPKIGAARGFGLIDP